MVGIVVVMIVLPCVLLVLFSKDVLLTNLIKELIRKYIFPIL